MRNADDQKPQYVDLSYGWQERAETTQLNQRRRRWWRVVIFGMLSLPVLIYILWRML